MLKVADSVNLVIEERRAGQAKSGVLCYVHNYFDGGSATLKSSWYKGQVASVRDADATGTASTTPDRRCAPLQRALACALLVFIVYGATWQTVHTHGTLTPRPSEASSVGNPDSSNSSARHTSHSGECLICQFQRQLSRNLVPNLPQVTQPAEAKLSPAGASARFYFSTGNAPTRGRAPPRLS